ncbi:MAG: hydrogenase/urease maturation nickel metallochaperone HypA [Spirochaetaceae bacterium]|nr:hydrogenase/urease maturation nickel metallochaperone HypA [Spirochaetaceae bacterium]
MHEASIAKDVFDIIMETIDTDSDLSGKPVQKINFRQSFPNTVVPDSFEFYFTELVKETVLDGAELNFEKCEEHGFFITSIEVN